MKRQGCCCPRTAVLLRAWDWAVRQLRLSTADIARRFGMSTGGVISKADDASTGIFKGAG